MNEAGARSGQKDESDDAGEAQPPARAGWRDYLSPRVWRIAFFWVLLRSIALLPFSLQMRFGRALGRLSYRVAKKPRRIAARNIELCFPRLTPEARERMVRRHFESLGCGIVEMCFSWWASERRLRRRMEIVGMEHLDAARAEGKGVLLLTAHFTTLEICGIMLSLEAGRMYAVFRPYRKNRLADEIVKRGRSRGAEAFLERDDVHAIIRSLRRNKMLWYASDQLVRPGKRSELVPFFGEPALAHSGILDLARITGARVVPFLPERRADGRYRLTLLPALDPFPTGDRRADLERIMRIIQRHVERDPAQYLWVRPRFAKRPPPLPDPYAARDP